MYVTYSTEEIERMARAIRNNRDMEQDPDILCPINAGGYYCQWVAGHYGGCVLGRGYRQAPITREVIEEN